MNQVSHSEARPFTFGGAVRLLWVHPSAVSAPTFDHVLILRKPTNTFTGPTDPAATVVLRGVGVQAAEYRSVFLPGDVATSDLYRTTLDDVSGWATTLYYAIYAMNAAETDVSSAVILSAPLLPVSTVEELDLIGTLMPFLNSYLNQQIAVGMLLVPAGVTNIQVVDGPPMLDNITFPVVSLHLDDDHPVGFAIGDEIGHLDANGDTEVARRGLLSAVTVAVVGVTDNPEVRRHLYRSLKGALIASRQLLEQHGLMNMEVSGRYVEDFVNYDMPLFSAELILRGSVVSSVSVPPQEQAIGHIDIAIGVLTPQEIDP